MTNLINTTGNAGTSMSSTPMSTTCMATTPMPATQAPTMSAAYMNPSAINAASLSTSSMSPTSMSASSMGLSATGLSSTGLSSSGVMSGWQDTYLLTTTHDTQPIPNKLGSMVIRNKRRKGWGYRCRDAGLLLLTFTLWLLAFSQTYLQMADSALFLQLGILLDLLAIIGLNFLGVFAVIHTWVTYERILYWIRKRRQARANNSASPGA